MQDAPWKHQFPQVFQKVRQIPLAKNLSPAQWMFLSLENSFISSDEYLSWAQKYYGLATLKSSFFESAHFSSASYYKFKNQSSAGSSLWGPQALPVFEWDNILFVACIDPYSVPSEVINQSGMICRPLLAKYEDLVKAWNLCLESGTPPPTLASASTLTATQQEIQKQTSAEPPLIAVTEPPVMPPPHEVAKNSDPALATASAPKLVVPSQKLELTINSPVPTEDLFELLNSAVENASGSPSLGSPNTQHSEEHLGDGDSHGSLEMPEGLNLTVHTELHLKKSPSLPSKTQDAVLKDAATTNDALPENLSSEALASNVVPTLSADPGLPSSSTLTSSTSTQGPATSTQSTAASPPAVANPSLATKTATSYSAATAPKSTATTPPVAAPLSENSFVEPGTKSTTRTYSSPPPLNPTPTISVIQTQELEEELTLGFTKAYQFYRNLMILKLKDNVALPVRWDPSYKKPKSLQGISLNEPSIFRIVARTKKPFHGPITPNAINDQFIEYWFDGHKPNYLTIHPLFFEKECVGLLLGASDEPLDRKDSLHLMESTAEMIEINFGANLAAA